VSDQLLPTKRRLLERRRHSIRSACFVTGMHLVEHDRLLSRVPTTLEHSTGLHLLFRELTDQ